MFNGIIENIRKNAPLVHAITNYVTVNDCANIILAAGGSPIMADDLNEVWDITAICNTLVINIGTLNNDTIEAMIVAGKQANKLGHPVILDPVGAGASKFRTDSVKRLLDEVKFAVIRGNISEIKVVAAGSGNTKGVDANEGDVITTENLSQSIQFVKSLSENTGAVIAVSGAIDLVCDKDKAYVITNGHETMTKITGTGCMLTALIGTFCGENDNSVLDCTAAAVTTMGLCGKLAYDKMIKTDSGLSSFRTFLIDYMSKMDSEKLMGGAKVELR